VKPTLSTALSLGALLGACLTAGCVAPVGPVEVTRFHVAEAEAAPRAEIAVEPAAGMDGQSLEFRSYAVAVASQLQRLGYARIAAPGTGAQVALVRVERETIETAREGGPVTVGLGGSAGSHGSAVGLGIGVNLSPPPPDQVRTTLSVTIRERAGNRALWEGRASFTVKASSPMADTQLGAPKLAEALFRGWPGQSGETILVP